MRRYFPLFPIFRQHNNRLAIEFDERARLITPLPRIKSNFVSKIMRHHALMRTHIIQQLQALMYTFEQHFQFGYAHAIEINHLHHPDLILAARLQSVLSRVVV